MADFDSWAFGVVVNKAVAVVVVAEHDMVVAEACEVYALAAS